MDGGYSFLDVKRSLKNARWTFPSVEQDIVSRISQMHGLPDFIARMLHIRGVSPEGVAAFLSPTLRDHFPDPFSLAGMKDLAEDFAERIMRKECIGILADFDVDGATSCAILTRFLKHCGQMPPIAIPDRLIDGYGPNAKALAKLKEEGARAVIMVDCGITAFAPVDAGREMGLDIAILDHHEPEESLPGANHIVNPKRRDDASGLSMLAACGVAFLTCVAINSILRREKFYEREGIAEAPLKDWIDLVGLGTVCDMVPMTGPNRLFVRAGFAQMSLLKNKGIKALCQVAGLQTAPEPKDAGFSIGPRINAGSRVHKSDLGARILSTDDAEEAAAIAFLLDECNEQRKEIQSRMMKEAVERVEREGLDREPIIIVSDPNWHQGISGLVAGRLKERFGKPAIVISFAENPDGVTEGRGSGRSVEGVNLAAAFIAARAAGILVKGGGHAMAAGLTIMPDRLPEFRDFMKGNIAAQAESKDQVQDMAIDAVATVRGAQVPFVRLVTDRIGPFGPQNVEPVFALAGVQIQTADVLKDKHIRLNITDWEGGRRMKAMLFHGVGTVLGSALLARGQGAFHIAGQFSINSWQGNESVEFMISDAAHMLETHDRKASSA